MGKVTLELAIRAGAEAGIWAGEVPSGRETSGLSFYREPSYLNPDMDAVNDIVLRAPLGLDAKVILWRRLFFRASGFMANDGINPITGLGPKVQGSLGIRTSGSVLEGFVSHVEWGYEKGGRYHFGARLVEIGLSQFDHRLDLELRITTDGKHSLGWGAHLVFTPEKSPISYLRSLFD